MDKTICVYSSSSCAIDKVYFEAAYELGKQIALRKDTVLFGGGLTGLMGEVAKSVQEHNGKVIGVIPEALNVKGIVYEYCDELIITKDMRERKANMDNRSDAFIALPGGYGTLEELSEIISLKQLHYHYKPIVILNINNFYDKLIDFFEHIIINNFAKRESGSIYYTAESISEALDYIDSYVPVAPSSKWLTHVEPL